MELAIAFAVPVFWRTTALADAVTPAAPWVIVVLAAETVAVFVNVPKRPNTKPAIAMAAMRVIAMRMTVAKTGLIPFLRLALMSFNLVFPLSSC